MLLLWITLSVRAPYLVLLTSSCWIHPHLTKTFEYRVLFMQQANLFQLLFFLDTWKTLLTAWQWQTSITVCFLKPRSLFLSITELFIFQKAFQSCVTKDSLCMRLNMVIQVCFSLSRAHTHTNWCDLMVTDSTVELSSGLQCWSPTTSGSQYFPSLHYCSPESSSIRFIGFLSLPLWVDCVGWTRLQESEQFFKKRDATTGQ